MTEQSYPILVPRASVSSGHVRHFKTSSTVDENDCPQSRSQSLRYPCHAERFPVPLDKGNEGSGNEIELL